MSALSPGRARTGLHSGLLIGAGAGLVAVWTLPPLWSSGLFAFATAVALTLRFPIVGFAFLAFSVPWGGGFPLTIGAFPITSTEVLVAALAAAWICKCLVDRRKPWADAIWAPYIALFVAVIVVSVSQAADTHASASEVLKWVELAVVYFSAITFLRTRRHVQIVVGAIVAAGVTQALLGFVQLAFSLGPASFASQRAFLRAYGTFDQPNPFGGYLNMVLPLAVAMAIAGPRGRAHRWYVAASIVLAAGVLASESRGALLAGVVAIAILLAFEWRGMRRLVWLAVLGTIAAGWLLAFGVSLGPFEKILDAVGLGGVSFGNVTNANFSAVERAAHWLAGIRMFASHPLLGVGIGNYPVAYPTYHPRGWHAALAHAHNYYINIAAEAGIAGLAAYLLFMGSALWYTCAAARLVHDRVYRAAALGVTGALIATGLHNIFDVLYVHGTPALIGLLMALASLGFGGTSHDRQPRVRAAIPTRG